MSNEPQDDGEWEVIPGSVFSSGAEPPRRRRVPQALDVAQQAHVSGQLRSHSIQLLGEERIAPDLRRPADASPHELRIVIDAAPDAPAPQPIDPNLRGHRRRSSRDFDAELRRHPPLAPEDRADQPVPRWMNEAFKRKMDDAIQRHDALLGGRGDVDRAQRRVRALRQQDIARAFGDSRLASMIAMFEEPPAKPLNDQERALYDAATNAFADVRRCAQVPADAAVTDGDLERLLRSPQAADQEAAKRLLSAVSLACKNPMVLDAAMPNNAIAPVRASLQGEESLDVTEMQTSFIKAARSKIATMMFQTDVERRLRVAATGLLDPPERIDQLVAAVGFNRAMSGNNMLGASLSSDIDFKLVIDDENAKRLLSAENYDRLVGRLVDQLKESEGEFRDRFALTLEVQSFTVKDFTTLRREAAVSDTEKNFLCTVYENHALMSGNPKVLAEFKKIIRDRVINGQGDGLPMRNYEQYLGDSDKGSIKAIKYLRQIEAAVERMAGIVAGDQDLAGKAAAALESEYQKLLRKKGREEADAFKALHANKALATALKDPVVMLAALENADVKHAADHGIDNELAAIPMFATQPAADRFKLLTKNLKAFTENGSHQFIGRDQVDANWIYSNKYGGCRLNDFFDATRRQRYADIYGERGRPELGARYDHVQHVAEAINRFAVQLQDRIYELCLAEGNLSHEDIDERYHRITAEDLGKLLENPDSNAHFQQTLETMLQDLERIDTVESGFTNDEIETYKARVKAYVEEMRQVAAEWSGSPMDRNDHDHISELTERQKKKLEQMLGVMSVNQQSDASRSLGEAQLAELINGLQAVPVSGLTGDDRNVLRRVQEAAMVAQERLNQPGFIEWLKRKVGLSEAPEPPPLNDADIKTLLESSSADDRSAGRALLAAVSQACKRPEVIEAGLVKGYLAAMRANLTSDGSVDSTELQTSYIKAARSKIANLMFQSEMKARLREAAKRAGLKPPEAIDDLVANIGFNRAMSENNTLGASLSSDIDFKLVLDDEELKKKLLAQGIDDPRKLAAGVDKMKAEMLKELQQAKGFFGGDLGCTLEVQSFTLKSLSKVQEEAKTSDTERNFLCTVYENQQLMSGSKKVQKKFLDAIRDGVIACDARGLPARNYDQYLGDSDKGSIRAIEKLDEIEAAMGAFADRVAGNPDLADKAKKKIREEIIKEHLKEHPNDQAGAEEAADAALRRPIKSLLRDPHFMLPALDDADIAAEAGKEGAIPNLGGIAMFGNKSGAAKLKLLAKNLKAFSDDGNSAFIGRPGLDTDSPWIFSNKYGACRLNDFFDATKRERYVTARGVLQDDSIETVDGHIPVGADAQFTPAEGAQRGRNYDLGKLVAVSVNRFAIQLQDRIYEVYGMGEGRMSHGDIDEKYHRVTKAEFQRMVETPALREKLLTSFDQMMGDLDKFESELATFGGDPETARWKALKADIANIRKQRAEIARGEGRVSGFEMFTAMASLVKKTADTINPTRQVTATPVVRRPRRAAPAPEAPDNKRRGKKLFTAMSNLVNDSAELLNPRRPLSGPRRRRNAIVDIGGHDHRFRRKTKIAHDDAVKQVKSGRKRAKKKRLRRLQLAR